MWILCDAVPLAVGGSTKNLLRNIHKINPKNLLEGRKKNELVTYTPNAVELVVSVLHSRERWLPGNHFRENAAHTPN